MNLTYFQKTEIFNFLENENLDMANTMDVCQWNKIYKYLCEIMHVTYEQHINNEFSIYDLMYSNSEYTNQQLKDVRKIEIDNLFFQIISNYKDKLNMQSEEMVFKNLIEFRKEVKTGGSVSDKFKKVSMLMKHFLNSSIAYIDMNGVTLIMKNIIDELVYLYPSILMIDTDEIYVSSEHDSVSVEMKLYDYGIRISDEIVLDNFSYNNYNSSYSHKQQ